MNLVGSIDLKKIPKEWIFRKDRQDGTEAAWINISVIEKRMPGKYGDTHFVKVSKFFADRGEHGEWDERIIGNLKPMQKHNGSSAGSGSAQPSYRRDGGQNGVQGGFQGAAQAGRNAGNGAAGDGVAGGFGNQPGGTLPGRGHNGSSAGNGGQPQQGGTPNGQPQQGGGNDDLPF